MTLELGDIPSSLSFQEADFWVHILDTPFDWLNHRMAEWEAGQIGKPISVQYHGATIRVRVSLDIMSLQRLLVI